MSVIGNLVGAQAAANMGWKERAVCLFSLGMVHYLVLFVTLYQRSGGDRLPVLLRPVFFLFFAAPSVASLASEFMVGTFDTASKMLFFLSLVLFTSLANPVQEIYEKAQCCVVGLLLSDYRTSSAFNELYAPSVSSFSSCLPFSNVLHSAQL
ncbi:hypothetical protein JHK87_014103 [Glycine soja]|nr:hypothetical protein JHK87_014103 [Glycine soja]